MVPVVRAPRRDVVVCGPSVATNTAPLRRLHEQDMPMPRHDDFYRPSDRNDDQYRGRSPRGFAAMDPEHHRELSRMGGRASGQDRGGAEARDRYGSNSGAGYGAYGGPWQHGGYGQSGAGQFGPGSYRSAPYGGGQYGGSSSYRYAGRGSGFDEDRDYRMGSRGGDERDVQYGDRGSRGFRGDDDFDSSQYGMRGRWEGDDDEMRELERGYDDRDDRGRSYGGGRDASFDAGRGRGYGQSDGYGYGREDDDGRAGSERSEWRFAGPAERAREDDGDDDRTMGSRGFGREDAGWRYAGWRDRGDRGGDRGFDEPRVSSRSGRGGRGFAGMDPERHREISRMGGLASHGPRDRDDDRSGRSSSGPRHWRR
jgi:general stress protein YciG